MMPTEHDILQALHDIPPQQWENVLKFVASLRPAVSKNEGGAEEPAILTAADLARSGLVGLWADRTDIGDSRAFARQLREQAQKR